jgi:hypothetical protein
MKSTDPRYGTAPVINAVAETCLVARTGVYFWFLLRCTTARQQYSQRTTIRIMAPNAPATRSFHNSNPSSRKSNSQN